MSKKITYIEGEKVGTFIYLGGEYSIDINGNKRRFATFKCQCGNEINKRVDEVVCGRIKTCGCISPNVRHGHAIHGKETTYYRIWSGIRTRCYNPKDHAYARYGGRGIKMCDRWLVFENFLQDVGKRPSKNHSIDRYPNNDGDYEPSNFRWATKKEQALNRSVSIRIEYKGEIKNIEEWGEIFKIRTSTLYDRIRRSKWSIEKSFLTPVRLSKTA